MATTPKELYIYDANGDINWWERLLEIKDYRYLLRNLVTRDIKTRYKNSVLGILWSLLNPLGLMVVFTIVFSILSGSGAPRQYPVFILVGIIPWRFFAGTLMSGSMSVIGNGNLIKKVYFPRALLPVAALLSELLNFLLGFVMLIVFLYLFDLGLTRHVVWLPFVLLTQFVFSLGLVYLLSAVATFYRDVLMILDVVLQAWFFLTPIFYSFETLFSEQATVMGITFNPTQVMRWVNPMASIVDGYRTILWGTVHSNGPVAMYFPYMLRTFATSLLVLVVGYMVFVRAEHKFGEVL